MPWKLSQTPLGPGEHRHRVRLGQVLETWMPDLNFHFPHRQCAALRPSMPTWRPLSPLDPCCLSIGFIFLSVLFSHSRLQVSIYWIISVKENTKYGTSFSIKFRKSLSPNTHTGKKKGLYSLWIVETLLCYQYIFLFAHLYLNGYTEFGNIAWFWQENLDDWKVSFLYFFEL